MSSRFLKTVLPRALVRLRRRIHALSYTENVELDLALLYLAAAEKYAEYAESLAPYTGFNVSQLRDSLTHKMQTGDVSQGPRTPTIYLSGFARIGTLNIHLGGDEYGSTWWREGSSVKTEKLVRNLLAAFAHIDCSMLTSFSTRTSGAGRSHYTFDKRRKKQA
ncbi:hypothetical protein CONPUDRAFT_71415 [Coniophora puteana RWD-64-598 SS2]|uniref:Uncharacterized protein n=1 Tax=Coniophora puteana (strain RWD-64-598) TaxID=741705 RepID=A0A5M3MVE0_CONPW|nr:uncharacterized protein CONPUDRAFT_71415 [Coniophora puteana RWD-64-598 SS2]EIW82675.1 hypothetical protein CONPUDRAFT_71415 [Coniophora puteana RWD-64-598 SS2]